MSLLEPSLVGDIRPLNDEQQSRLQRNYSILLSTIDSKNSILIEELYAADCITFLRKEYIDSAARRSESNKRLVDIMSRGSETDFHKFIECLNKTCQRHISRILIEDGTVAFIVATTSPAHNREQQEKQIVDQLTAILRDTPEERRDEFINEALSNARQPLHQLRENEVTILTVEIGHSIGLFYFVTTLRGLQYLHEQYSNEQLKSMMQDVIEN